MRFMHQIRLWNVIPPGGDVQLGEILAPEIQASISAISNACDANQTPLILRGEFG